MIRTYWLELEKDSDEGVHPLLFAARKIFQENKIGFSPSELVFGRTVRDPLKVLKLLKEKWPNAETDTNLLDYVSKFKNGLIEQVKLLGKIWKRQNTRWKHGMTNMPKTEYLAQERECRFCFQFLEIHFKPDTFIPILLESKVGEVDYIVKTPDRRKNRLLSCKYAERICR